MNVEDDQNWRQPRDRGSLGQGPLGLGASSASPAIPTSARPKITPPYPDAVESTVTARLDDRHPGTSGPIGVALGPAADRLIHELIAAAMAGAAEIGRDARLVHPGDDQSHLGVLLGIGHPSGFMPVFAAPWDCPRVIWVGEALLRRDEPAGGPLTRIARSSVLDHLRYPLRPLKDMPLPGPLARARTSAWIERQRAVNLREFERLARSVDRMVVTSRDRRAALLEYGLSAEVVPYGYSAAEAGPITLPDRGDRDLTFVSLGTPHSPLARRRAVVERWVERWRAEEPRLTVLAGVWGQERGDLLRRSRVVVSVARIPGEFSGIRLVLAIAAGAVVVSEPMTDPFPFVAGVHFVEAPLEGLLDAARELCADEPRRRRIAVAGQALLIGELSMARCLSRALGLGA